MFKSLINIFLFAFLIKSGLFAGNPHDLVIDYTTDNQACTNCHTTDELAASTMSCLTCHDGVLATNVAVNVPGSVDYYPTLNYLNNTDPSLISSNNLPGSNILNDNGMNHPVSIMYDENLDSLKYRTTIILSWDGADSINDLLINDQIECVSCHNPHDKVLPTYLRRSNYRSNLCKTCHTQ